MREYANFDIELLGHASLDGRETMRARVLDSPAGGEKDADAIPVEFPADVRDGLARLHRRELSGDEIIELGTKLGLLLLPPHARGRYRESLAGLGRGKGLRIRIRADTPELASLPWEFACIVPPDLPAGHVGAECFLGLDRRISIVRYEGSLPAAPPQSQLAREEIQVAVLLADVEDDAYPRLDLAQEELNLRRALDGIARVKTDYFQPGTVDQLEGALDKGIQVLHFAGHGEWQERMGEQPGSVEGEGRLVLASDDRRPAPLDVSQLAANLRARGVRLAVLAVCEGARRDAVNAWTGIAPVLVRAGIPACIGMQYSVRDTGAIAFSKRFYDQLAEGLSIDTSVAEARVAVFSRPGGAERDWGAPVLYLRSTQNLLFPLPPGPLRLNLALLAANLLVLGAWFYLHLYPRVGALLSQWTLALGGLGVLAGLWFILKLVWSLVQLRADTERTPWPHRMLRKKPAPWLLGSLLVVGAMLASVSGSFWLTLEETATEEPAVVTFMPADGLPFAKGGRLNASKDRPVAGGPFLFPIRGQRKASVESPPGWELKAPVQPRLWFPVHLRFPSSFHKPEIRLLVLATGLGIAWPTADEDEPGRTFTLKVTVDKGGSPVAADGANTFEVKDVRDGLLFLGASRNVLEQRVDEKQFEDVAGLLAACIPDPQHRDEWLSRWQDGKREFISTPVFDKGDSVLIQVTNNRNTKSCFQETVQGSDIGPGKIKVRCLVLRSDCLSD